MGSPVVTITPDAVPVTITPDAPPSAPAPPDSATSRFGSNLASGAGVMSKEDTKTFFTHPLDALKAMAQSQGALGIQAKKELANKDYVRGLTHAVEYLIPGMGPNLAQAGTQLEQGDIAGGVGRTLGSAIPIVAGSPEARALPGKAIAATREVAPYAAPVAKAGAQVLDIASFNRLSKLYNAYKEMRSELGDIADAKNPGTYPGAQFPATPPPELLQSLALARGSKAAPTAPSAALGSIPVKPEPPAIYPGAKFPANPSAQLLQSRSLAQGATAAPPPQSAGLGKIPVRAEPAPVTPQPTPEGMPASHPQGTELPVTLNGESALRQVLGGQGNANLLKIAKSRGINVTKESQLKAGLADNLLVNKIINDFSPDELNEIRDQYLENTRFRHSFGDVGPEAWKTLSIKTYFPDVKIAQATLTRTTKAISSGDDLLNQLRESVKQAQAAKAAKQAGQ